VCRCLGRCLHCNCIFVEHFLNRSTERFRCPENAIVACFDYHSRRPKLHYHHTTCYLRRLDIGIWLAITAISASTSASCFQHPTMHNRRTSTYASVIQVVNDCVRVALEHPSLSPYTLPLPPILSLDAVPPGGLYAIPSHLPRTEEEETWRQAFQWFISQTVPRAASHAQRGAFICFFETQERARWDTVHAGSMLRPFTLIIRPDRAVIWTPELGSAVDWETLQLPTLTEYLRTRYAPVYGGIAPDPIQLTQLEHYNISPYHVMCSDSSISTIVDAPSSSLYGSGTTAIDVFDFWESAYCLSFAISDEILAARPRLSQATRRHFIRTTGAYPRNAPRALPVPLQLRGQDTVDEPLMLMARAVLWAQQANRLATEVGVAICDTHSIVQTTYDSIHLLFRSLTKASNLLCEAATLLDHMSIGAKLYMVDPGRQYLDKIENYMMSIGNDIGDANDRLKHCSCVPVRPIGDSPPPNGSHSLPRSPRSLHVLPVSSRHGRVSSPPASPSHSSSSSLPRLIFPLPSTGTMRAS
jgi:hypothetical protein